MCGLGRAPSLSVAVLLLQGSPSLILRICLAVFCSGDPLCPQGTPTSLSFQKRNQSGFSPHGPRRPSRAVCAVRARFLILTLPAPRQKGRVLACVL